MKHQHFVQQLEENQIVTAIQEAESKSSGEIRVFVSRRKIDDPLAAAQQAFIRLGLQRTRERNGVLIFVAPRTHKFAVIGDAGIHSHCGDEFWRAVSEAMSDRFIKGEFTQGILHAIRTAGDLLAQHFPHQPDDRNELPDDLAHD